MIWQTTLETPRRRLMTVAIIAVLIALTCTTALAARKGARTGPAMDLARRAIPSSVRFVIALDAKAMIGSDSWKANEPEILQFIEGLSGSQLTAAQRIASGALDTMACGANPGQGWMGCAIGGAFGSLDLSVALGPAAQPETIDGVPSYVLGPMVFAVVSDDTFLVGTRGFVEDSIALSKGRTRSVVDEPDVSALLRRIDRSACLWMVIRDGSMLDEEIGAVVGKPVSVRGGALSAALSDDIEVRGALAMGTAASASGVRDAHVFGLRVLARAAASGGLPAAVRGITGRSEGRFAKLGVHIHAGLLPVLLGLAAGEDHEDPTNEVIADLDSLFLATAKYGTRGRIDADGSLVGCLAPPSAELTPPGSPCDYPDDRYPETPSLWSDDPAWAALGFRPKGAGRYRYSSQSTQEGDHIRFTVTARGDLDCDGTWSTFTWSGALRWNEETRSCELTEETAPVIDQPFE